MAKSAKRRELLRVFIGISQNAGEEFHISRSCTSALADRYCFSFGFVPHLRNVVYLSHLHFNSN